MYILLSKLLNSAIEHRDVYYGKIKGIWFSEIDWRIEKISILTAGGERESFRSSDVEFNESSDELNIQHLSSLESSGFERKNAVEFIARWSGHSRDGHLGTIVDFIIELPQWRIRHIVVENTRNADSSSQFVLPSSLAWELDPSNKIVKLSIPTDRIQKAPKFSPHSFRKWEEVELLEYFRNIS